MEGLGFAKCDYHLEESDPDIVILRRQDDTLVARFSARGATKEGIVEAAKEDYRELIRAHTDPLLGQQSEGRGWLAQNLRQGNSANFACSEFLEFERYCAGGYDLC